MEFNLQVDLKRHHSLCFGSLDIVALDLHRTREPAPGLSQSCESGDVERIETILREVARESACANRDLIIEGLDSCLFDAIASSHRPMVPVLFRYRTALRSSSFTSGLKLQDFSIWDDFFYHDHLDMNTYELLWRTLRVDVKSPVLVKWLLELGATPDRSNDRGLTPLGTCAIRELSPEIEQTIDHLLRCGADIRKEKSILHLAIRPTASGGVAMLKHLLSRGADPSYKDPDTGTPLHYAASLGKMEEAKVLAATEGVDLGSVVCGCTASDVARWFEYDEIAVMLDDMLKEERRSWCSDNDLGHVQDSIRDLDLNQ